MRTKRLSSDSGLWFSGQTHMSRHGSICSAAVGKEKSGSVCVREKESKGGQ